MSIIWSAVPCSEEHGTVSEGADMESGQTGSVTLRCDRSLRWTLVNDILLNRRSWAYGGTRCKAKTAGIRSFPSRGNSNGQGFDYDHALVTIGYSVNAKEEETETDLVAESLEPTVEFLTLDHKDFRWGSSTGDPLKEAEAPGKLVRGFNLVRTIYNLNALPNSLLDLPGSCNLNSYSSGILGQSFGAETLMFGAPSMNRTLKSDGSGAWTLTLNFSYKKDGWNKFYRAKTGTYQSIYNASTGLIHKNYPPMGFSSYLF